MMRFSFCREIGLVALAIYLAASSAVMAQSCGPYSLNQNVDPDLVINNLAIVCADGPAGPNIETRFARTYDLFADLTAVISPCSQGRNFSVNCVSFAVQSNNTAGYEVFVNIYQDLNGGVPFSEGVDLLLLGSTSVVIPVVSAASPEIEKHFTADFTLLGDPVFVPVDSIMVVELLLPDRSGPEGDGGLMLPGCNNTGESAVSYILAPVCLGSTFVKVDDFSLDQPDAMLIQTIDLQLANPIPACPGDCADGSGDVDVIDLLALLAEWGLPAQACDIAGGDDNVNVTDLLALLGGWGACPLRPAFCFGDTDLNGQVNVTDMLDLLSVWGLGCATEDLDFDGVVNVIDLLLLLGAWGICPS